MLTTTQVATAQAIVNIFETGAALGDYSAVTVIPGDTGHLTYGRSQTTLGSGNLFQLVNAYTGNAGARFGTRLTPYLPGLKNEDLSLDHDLVLQNLLRAAADDVVMRGTQDAFFDKHYWQPAQQTAGSESIGTALGVTVVYDSFVHGSWKTIHDQVVQNRGSVAAIGEQAWITAYVAARLDWLANSPRDDLRRTTYRMIAIQRLIDQGMWGLPLPLVVRGCEISQATLTGLPPGCYDGPAPGSRALMVATPLQRGVDVRLTQLGLSAQGIDIKADGIYGQTSMKIIKAYQDAHGMPATGVADVALVAALSA